MGDHRASIKIELEMYGESEASEFSINWWPDSEYGGVDRRVAEWLLAAVDKCREKDDAKARKELELRQLAALKAKYPDK